MLANILRRETRSDGGLSWGDYINLWEQFGFNGSTYTVPSGAASTLTALQAIRNPVVLAAIVLRMMTLSEIQFAFRPKVGSKGARDLFYAEVLDILDAPYPGAAPGELVSRMSLDADLHGNAYWYPSTSLATLGSKSPRRQLTHLDPTKVHILTGDQEGPSGAPCGKTLLAYQAQDKNGQPEETFLPGELLHYKPIPDPDQPFRGMSWLRGLLPDIQFDNAATTFKTAFLNNAATPNLVVTFTNNIGPDAFKAFQEKLEAGHTGPAQGFKTLYLGSGADVKVVGSMFKDLQLDSVQAYGETRISSASGVPAALLGIAEGLKGSTLNTGNYVAVRRRYADMTVRPLWRRMCGACAAVAPPASGNELWYDERGVAFLTADLQDQASVRTSDSTTIANLTNSGYTPESVKEAVVTNDWSLLEHSQLISVQLQPPTIEPPAPAAAEGGSNDGNTDN